MAELKTATVKWPGKLWEGGQFGDRVSATILDGQTEIRIGAKPGTDKAEGLLRLRKGQKVHYLQAGTYEGKPYYDVVVAPYYDAVVAPESPQDERSSPEAPSGRVMARLMATCYWEMKQALVDKAPDDALEQHYPDNDQVAKLAVAIFIQYFRDR